MHYLTVGAKVKSKRIGPGLSLKKAQLCANERRIRIKPSISNPKLKRFGPQKTCSKTDYRLVFQEEPPEEGLNQNLGGGEGQAQKHRQAIEDYHTTPRIQSGKRILIIYSSEGWRKFSNKATMSFTLNTLH